ncbi:MAG: putative rRNA maturation factor YbeY [Acidimicrobiaceae bacterium]|nr:putative rRNA maturation factor YbeY [Acidimicrobiaceae bacterium]
MGVEVFVTDEQTDRPVDTERWAGLAQAVLTAEGITGDAELSVLYVDALAITSMNERFLGHEGPTDVLSFPIDDASDASRADDQPGAAPPGELQGGDEGNAPLLLGDVVICPQVAFSNAPEHAGTYDDELALLLVHGILHVLGRDHEADAEAEAMEAREQELLDQFHRGRLPS